jgi:hypothetical protein
MQRSFMFLHSRGAVCQPTSSTLNPHGDTRIKASNVSNAIVMFIYLYYAWRIPSHITILVGITSRSKCNAKNLETFEASTNTPFEQIYHIDSHILSWNFPKIPKASSQFHVIGRQAAWGNRDLRWIWSLDKMKGDMYSRSSFIKWQACWEWYVKWRITDLGHLSIDGLGGNNDKLSKWVVMNAHLNQTREVFFLCVCRACMTIAVGKLKTWVLPPQSSSMLIVSINLTRFEGG